MSCIPVYPEKPQKTHNFIYPKFLCGAVFQINIFLFGRAPPYPADIFTSRRPSDPGPPIQWSSAISDHP